MAKKAFLICSMPSLSFSNFTENKEFHAYFAITISIWRKKGILHSLLAIPKGRKPA